MWEKKACSKRLKNVRVYFTAENALEIGKKVVKLIAGLEFHMHGRKFFQSTQKWQNRLRFLLRSSERCIQGRAAL